MEAYISYPGDARHATRIWLSAGAATPVAALSDAILARKRRPTASCVRLFADSERSRSGGVTRASSPATQRSENQARLFLCEYQAPISYIRFSIVGPLVTARARARV